MRNCKKIFISAAVIACMALTSAGTAFAADTDTDTETQKPSITEHKRLTEEELAEKATVTEEEALDAAEEAYPDYTFTETQLDDIRGIAVYRIKGTDADGNDVTVIISAEDGTVVEDKGHYSKGKGDSKKAPSESKPEDKDNTDKDTDTDTDKQTKPENDSEGRHKNRPEGMPDKANGENKPDKKPEGRPEGAPPEGKPEGRNNDGAEAGFSVAPNELSFDRGGMQQRMPGEMNGIGGRR